MNKAQLVFIANSPPSLEEAFGKMKGILHQAQARSLKIGIEALGRALDEITSQDARGFFRELRLPNMGSTVVS